MYYKMPLSNTFFNPQSLREIRETEHGE
jgi:hypothetical protein